jgi:bifunctional DNA-binding transcriptional regulator/antitoxin component of YhaV-PrlF toxin-antitoxin module
MDGDTFKIWLVRRGSVTLPKSLREAYRLQPGDELTLLDLGGVFALSPRRSEVDVLAERIASALSSEGETLESVLGALRERRKSGESLWDAHEPNS